ncbi:hypothetical protein F5884DRAFT_734456 [Xylogone sp. PMI_703]|nr:hypothetical protein F5884DRAFT_734456 [Xylogone sp. PMI_703]
MVYFGGKPSRGCPQCRSRKIKCDREPGGCMNCQKKGYECQGYRSDIDLKFRDETWHVAQKSMNKGSKEKDMSDKLPLRGPAKMLLPPAKSGNQYGPRNIEASQQRSTASSAGHKNPVNFMVAQGGPEIVVSNFDDQALAFFFSNYVIGRWSFAHGMSIRSSRLDDALFFTIKVVGLAGISGFAHGSRLRLEARKRYLTAIQHVNKAIMSPEIAKRDSTLLSIILLTQVEAIDCYTSRSLAAWENHIKGAAAIIKLRGAEKLRNPLEVRLFAQAVSGLLVSCKRNCIHLPNELFDLVEIAAQYMDAKAPGWSFFRVHMLTAQFLANVHHKIIANPTEILQQALALDSMIITIFNNAGPEWEYDTIIDNTNSDMVPLGYYYRYPNFLAAQVCSGMRSIRIDLHEVIRNSLLRGLAAHDPPTLTNQEHALQFQESTSLLYQLQSELFACASQYLIGAETKSGNILKFPWSNFKPIIYNPSLISASVSEDIPLVRSIGRYVLPWALYKAGKVSVSTSEMREKAIKLLKFAGGEMEFRRHLC